MTLPAEDIRKMLDATEDPTEREVLEHVLKAVGTSSRCSVSFRKKLAKLLQRSGSLLAADRRHIS